MLTKVIRDTTGYILEEWKSIVTRLFFVILLMVMFTLSDFDHFVLDALIYSVFCVAIHRVVLIGFDGVSRLGVKGKGGREIVFLINFFVIAFLPLIIVLILSAIVAYPVVPAP